MSTKELIIEAAFSFYSKPYTKDFSLNELAQKVGISKPAIYRHFKNKEGLIEGMQAHFFDIMAKYLAERRLSETKMAQEDIPFASMIQFFADNTQYINYLLVQFSRQCDFEKVIYAALDNRHALDDDMRKKFQSMQDGKNRVKKTESFFSGVSMLYFIKAREKVINKSMCENSETEIKSIKSTEEFSRNLVLFIKSGFEGSTEKDDILHPTIISDGRKKELREICKINTCDFPEENRIFKAFATVIRKYDFGGVTIERIANELGMAKSSLYFYFENKNAMIASLIEKEMTMLTQICIESSSEARNFSEYIYLSLHSEVEFFKIRPSILPICGWLLQTSVEGDEFFRPEICSAWETKLPQKIKNLNLGFPMCRDTLKYWIGMLPVMLFLMVTNHKIGEQELDELLEKLFDFIQFGIEECR